MSKNEKKKITDVDVDSIVASINEDTVNTVEDVVIDNLLDNSADVITNDAVDSCINNSNDEVAADAQLSDDESADAESLNGVDAVEISEDEAEFDADGKKIKKKKTSKTNKSGGVKRLKRWHIVVISITTVFVLIGAGIGIFFAVVAGMKGDASGIDAASLKVDMGDMYYVGTVNDIDLSKAFPDETIGNVKGGSAVIEGNILKINGTEKFELKIGKITKKVIVIDGGVNVDTYDEFFAAVNVDKLPVVVQVPELVMTNKVEDTATKRCESTLYLEASAYGNGVHLNAHEVVKATANDKYDWGVAGNSAFSINKAEKITLRDFHVTGKDFVEGDDLYAYTNYGSLLMIRGIDVDTNLLAPRTKPDVIHNVFEKSHKVVHIINAEPYLEGNIIRDAADTSVSIGAFANQGSEIIMKNNLIANSLTGGILFYCFDPKVTQANAAASYSTLKIEGFLDIFNWKDESELVFLPKTEELLLPAVIVDFANGMAGSEIKQPKYDDMKAIYEVKEKNAEGILETVQKKSIHFGIIKIRTAGGNNKTNDSKVIGMENVGFTEEVLPLPDLAKMILQDMDVYGYFAKQDGAAGPADSIADNKSIYEELRTGRK